MWVSSREVNPLLAARNGPLKRNRRPIGRPFPLQPPSSMNCLHSRPYFDKNNFFPAEPLGLSYEKTDSAEQTSLLKQWRIPSSACHRHNPSLYHSGCRLRRPVYAPLHRQNPSSKNPGRPDPGRPKSAHSADHLRKATTHRERETRIRSRRS